MDTWWPYRSRRCGPSSHGSGVSLIKFLLLGTKERKKMAFMVDCMYLYIQKSVHSCLTNYYLCTVNEYKAEYKSKIKICLNFSNEMKIRKLMWSCYRISRRGKIK
jgi:hypothetical protein